MTADTASLQERLWEAVAEVRDQHPRVFNDAPTDDVIAAIFPIIAAEVRAAKAEAWEQGYGDCWNYHQSNGLAGTYRNPYRATETGDRA